jgi:hypothetical protein
MIAKTPGLRKDILLQYQGQGNLLLYDQLTLAVLFSHNMRGPIPPIPDLSSFPAAEEALRVTDELCDKYRVLKREVEILQEENSRLRRMLEIFLAPVMIAPPPLKE